jgi:hypothetical protein
VNRTLKPSARPFIVFAIILSPLSVFGVYDYFEHGRPFSYSLQVALLPVALYVLFIALISSVRVSVSSDGITITRWYALKQFIPFAEVDHSDVQILAERSWPVQITIYSKHRRLAQLGLKAVQQKDAAWLCSLAELKCVTHPGLTRRA